MSQCNPHHERLMSACKALSRCNVPPGEVLHFPPPHLGFDTETLIQSAYAVMASRPSDHPIKHLGEVYLDPWYLKRAPDKANYYLHCFRTDDPNDRGLHDHPWDSLSILLAGEQQEIWRSTGTHLKTNERTLKPFDVVHRPAHFTHRLIITKHTPITLFVTGPCVRRWGFWPMDERSDPVFTPWTRHDDKVSRRNGSGARE